MCPGFDRGSGDWEEVSVMAAQRKCPYELGERVTCVVLQARWAPE